MRGVAAGIILLSLLWMVLFGLNPLGAVIRTFAPQIEPNLVIRYSLEQEVDCLGEDCYAVNQSPNVYYFNARTGEQRTLFSDKRGFVTLSLSPDGRKLYAATPGSVFALSSLNGRVIAKELYRYPKRWEGERPELLALSSSDDALLFGANTARVYLGSASNKVRDFSPRVSVSRLLRNPRGEVFALFQDENEDIVARLDGAAPSSWREVYRAKEIDDVSWSKSGIVLVVDGGLMVGTDFLNLRPISLPANIKFLPFDFEPSHAAISEEGRLAVAMDNGVSIRDPQGRWSSRNLKCHPRALRWVDENTVVATNNFNFIEIFRI